MDLTIGVVFIFLEDSNMPEVAGSNFVWCVGKLDSGINPSLPETRHQKDVFQIDIFRATQG